MLTVPSELQRLVMYIIFSTPFTSCSMGITTFSISTSGDAPGYAASIAIVGGTMSGYCDIGRDENPIAPKRIITTETTVAKIGRSMKKLQKFFIVETPAALF